MSDFKFVHVYDGVVFARTASQVVTNLDEAERNGVEPGRFYVVTDGDGLAEVTFAHKVGAFDERDWAAVDVTILRKDTGSTVGSGSYAVDGRS